MHCNLLLAPDESPLTTPTDIERSGKSQTLDVLVPYKMLTCRKPEPTKQKRECKLSTESPMTDLNRKKDLAWVIGCLDFNEEDGIGIKVNAAGTWGAFNSLLSSSNVKTNVALVPPLLRSPPTVYDTLYTGLMRAHDITTHVMGDGSITVMTLDLQLYDMAMKLWVEREDVRKQFLFRPGELHVVFWALTALGKYIEGSGIDQAWVEAGLYSPTTLIQILNGKHMYRSLEAHMVTLLALYNLYFQSFLTNDPEERPVLNSASTILHKAYHRDIIQSTESRKDLSDAVSEVIAVFESRDILKKLAEFEGNLNKMQHFILNYIKQFETILQFV